MRSLFTLLTLALVVLLLPAPVLAQEAGDPQPLMLQRKTDTPDKVAAVVNGEKIMESEITKIIDRELRGATLPPDKMKQIHQQLLDMFINQHLVAQFIATQNIAVDPKEVDKEIAEIQERIKASGMSFEDIMKAEGVTEVALRQQITSGLALQKYIDQSVTDKAVKDFYDAHKAEWGGEEVRASHILVKYPGKTPTPAEKQAALEKIKSIQGELAKGLDFAEAAKKYSDCPSKKSGGDLDFFPRQGHMVEPFAEAAFALKKGAVSPPVETEFGMHLIKCTDRRTKQAKGLEEVREEIKSRLSQELMEKVADTQRKSAKIEIPN